jgi:hypothetical protein
MRAPKPTEAPAPVTHSQEGKARQLGNSELERDQEEFRAALKITKRGLAARKTKFRKSA